MTTYKVAIVGAGPAGYFAAQALQNLQTDDLQFTCLLYTSDAADE